MTESKVSMSMIGNKSHESNSPAEKSPSLKTDIKRECQNMFAPNKPLKHDYACHTSLGDISVALISPGFSKSVMNDQAMREQIRLSLDVKNLQEGLIQRRLNAQFPQAQKDLARRSRKAPKGLTLSRHRVRITSGPQTAPLHGRQRRNYSRLQEYPRSRSSSPDESTPGDPDRNFRLPPMTSIFPPRSWQLTPTSGPNKGNHLPPWQMPTRMMPPSPPTTSHAAQPGSGGGLDTLSRAADLKSMKDEYLKACAAGFDALHGLA